MIHGAIFLAISWVEHFWMLISGLCDSPVHEVQKGVMTYISPTHDIIVENVPVPVFPICGRGGGCSTGYKARGGGALRFE